MYVNTLKNVWKDLYQIDNGGYLLGKNKGWM